MALNLVWDTLADTLAAKLNVTGHGRMAYPKHTLFYSAVLDQVQTHSVASCGFKYCGVGHNSTVYRNTLLHLPRMGINSNLNNLKQRKQSCANRLYY